MLLETFQTFKQEIQAASRRGASIRTQFAPKTAAPAVIAFVYLVLSRIDLERCEAFFFELHEGPAQPGPEYPIFVLRERLTWLQATSVALALTASALLSG